MRKTNFKAKKHFQGGKLFFKGSLCLDYFDSCWYKNHFAVKRNTDTVWLHIQHFIFTRSIFSLNILFENNTEIFSWIFQWFKDQTPAEWYFPNFTVHMNPFVAIVKIQILIQKIWFWNLRYAFLKGSQMIPICTTLWIAKLQIICICFHMWNNFENRNHSNTNNLSIKRFK